MKISNKRIFALVVDLIIISQITMLVERFVDLTIFAKSYQYGSMVVVQKVTLHFLFVIGYFMLFDLFLRGNTIGKKIFTISVTKGNGSEPGTGNRVLRTLIKLVSLILLPVSALVYLVNGSSLHDYLLKTITIDQRQLT